MASITLNSNVASLNAQARLAESTEALTKSFERLSTGLRINHASDDAAGLAIAASLDMDARVFDQGVRNVNDGISYLNVADGATGAFEDILIRLRELATESSNGTFSDRQRQALDTEAQALIGEFNRIVQVTSFNGVQIFGSANPQLTVQAGYGQQGTLTALLGNTTSVTTPDGTFQAKQDFATGSAPKSVAAADFNGDGKLDLVVTDNSAGGKVSVLLGNGDGTFQAKQDFATTAGASGVTIADVNGDGKEDLVVADSGVGKVSVLLGNGDGTFQAKQDFTVGGSPKTVGIADFNGDGKLDLAVANVGSNTVSVLLGNGNGTFQARQDYGTGSGPAGIAVGDFNGDGKADLAVPDQGGPLSVLLGNGDGTFQAKQDYGTGTGPQSIAGADVNGDGKLDLVTANNSGNTVSVLLGNGDGTFQAKQDFATGNSPAGDAIADFNGDGKLDLVVTDNSAGGKVSVLLGNGDGTFQAKQDYGTGGGSVSVAIGDFNADGIKDLATANNSANTVSVLLGNGTTTTQTVGIEPIRGISVATQAAALSAQGTIDSYLDTVNSVDGAIGAAMSRFRIAADNLRTDSLNFTEAESRITDADIPEETANLVKARILQQAGTAVLAQANLAPALILVLLNAA